MLAATMERLFRYGETAEEKKGSACVPPLQQGAALSSTLTVHHDGEQAVEQRVEALVSTGDDFVEDLNREKWKN